MTPVCPFVKASRPDDASSKKAPENLNKKDSSSTLSPKCPFGYDSHSFKLGPLSCIICQALLFDSSKCVPCSHVFCKVCISRFNDCPLCGADIEKIEPDANLQTMVDRFIEGHGRIKRSQVNADEEGQRASEDNDENNNSSNAKNVIYEDVSLERGSFLVQQAMRAFRGQNVESAKSRLSLCAEDLRSEIETAGKTSELCSQLGAVLGMLGDCSRAIGEATSAIKYFEESTELLLELPKDDFEITHTLSVSLNKIGDLKYYDGDLEAARSYYFQSLNIRRDAIKHSSDITSQSLDVAVSLAKVADVDRSIGNEEAAVDGFREAIKLLESLSIKPEEAGLEQRRHSVLEFLNNQVAEKQSENATS